MRRGKWPQPYKFGFDPFQQFVTRAMETQSEMTMVECLHLKDCIIDIGYTVKGCIGIAISSDGGVSSFSQGCEVWKLLFFLNGARLHQGMGQKIPDPPLEVSSGGRVRRRDLLGGVLHDDYRAA